MKRKAAAAIAGLIFSRAGKHLPRQRPLVRACAEEREDDFVQRRRKGEHSAREYARHGEWQGDTAEHRGRRSSEALGRKLDAFALTTAKGTATTVWAMITPM